MINKKDLLSIIEEMILKNPKDWGSKKLELYMSYSNYDQFVLDWITAYSYQPFCQDNKHPLFPNITIVPHTDLNGLDHMFLTIPKNIKNK